MIDDQYKTKQNRRNQGQETIIKEEVIDIFFFNIWWLLKESFYWWFLKTSVVPLAIFPNSPPLVEGKILCELCDFVDPFFLLVY